MSGRTQFVLVDANTAAKAPAFDHDRLAAISTPTGGTHRAPSFCSLPHPPDAQAAAERSPQRLQPLTFAGDVSSLQLDAGGSMSN